MLKAVSGGKEVPPLKPQDGGYDAFDSPQGDGTWYAAKGPGFVAFGPDETLVAAVARPGEESLEKALTPALARPFLAGDVGLYVNAAALSTRFADQIDKARQGLMAALDQAGQQMGNAASMDAAKMIYGGLFDRLKEADALTLDVDFAAEGLHLAGALAVKADSDAAKAISASRTGTAADLGKFPADSAFYIYMNMDARSFDRLQGMGMRMLNPGGKATPAIDRAMARFREVGQVESIGASTIAKGMRAVNVMNVADPKEFISAVQDMLLAMKGDEGSPGIYKDVKIDADVETHRGFTFNHAVARVDLDKMAKLGGNTPAGAMTMKSMLDGDSLSYWLGTDGKRVIQVMTPTWEDAEARIDAFLDGDAGIGTTPGYQAVRSLLPEQASLLMLVNAQGMVRMLASQFAAALNKPDLKPPGDLPEEPALLGFSLTPRRPTGYEFHFVLPSRVGPVFETGLVPLFEGMRGQAGKVEE